MTYPGARSAPLLLRLRSLLPAVLIILGMSNCAAAAGGVSPPGAVVVEDQAIFMLRAAVGSISPAERAGIVNRRIEQVLNSPTLHPELLEARPEANGGVLLAVEELPLVQVTAVDAAAAETSPEALAERWKSELREALIEAKPLHRPHQEEHGFSFQPLLLVSVLAFFVPLAAAALGRRLPLPVVVGEILVGMLIGRSGSGWVHYDSWLRFLSEFGFAFLMFLSGLEVDFGLLRAGRGPAGLPPERGRWRRNPVAVACLTFALTVGLAAGVAIALTQAGFIRHPLLMTLVLSTTSLGMVVPVLKERGSASTPFGQTLLLSALVADFVTMFLITLVAGFIASGPTLRLFLVLVLLAAFAGAVRLAQWATGSPRVLRVFGSASHAAQLPVRGSLALMLVFVALSEQLGTEVILGAFLAGVLLSLLIRGEGAELRPKLEALGFGFFIPVFFIMVGVRFDLSALVTRPDSLLLAFWLIAGAMAIKLGASLPFRWMAPWRQTLAGGFLMSSRLSLIIAAAEIGRRLGLFSETVHAAAICVALVTCVMGPLGFQALMPRDEAAGDGGPHDLLHAPNDTLSSGDANRLLRAATLDTPLTADPARSTPRRSRGRGRAR